MTKLRKRRYPGALLRVIATTLGSLAGLLIIAIASTKPIDKTDLPLYARKIVDTNRSLSKRDIAFIYTVSQYENPISLSTPKRIVFSSMLGVEHIEVNEESWASPWSVPATSAQIETLVYAGVGVARSFDHSRASNAKSQRSIVDTTLNHALIAAYLSLADKQDLDGEFEVCVSKSGDNFCVSLEQVPTVPFTPSLNVVLDKRFNPVPGRSGGLVN